MTTLRLFNITIPDIQFFIYSNKTSGNVHSCLTILPRVTVREFSSLCVVNCRTDNLKTITHSRHSRCHDAAALSPEYSQLVKAPLSLTILDLLILN